MLETKIKIENINNKLITTSLNIAEIFSKKHCNILRDIKKLRCSENFTKLNFEFSEYIDETGKTNPMYNITKDGFVFLVMGYTGEKACQFKELYIKTFNELEQQFKNNSQTPHLPKPQSQLKPINTIDLSNFTTWQYFYMNDPLIAYPYFRFKIKKI